MEKRVENKSFNDTDLELEQMAPFRLARLTEALVRGATVFYSENFGLTLTELRVLAILGSFSPVSANEISQMTRIDKGWISRSVNNLIERAYVGKRQDPKDSRRYLLELTEKGRGVYDEVRAIANQRHQNFLSVLTDDEKDMLGELIGRLLSQADKIRNGT